MITEIPLTPVPNQSLSFALGGSNYDITLESRLNNLFATVTKDGEYLICNRICRNMTYICQWLIFADTAGNTDPVYTGLGSRYRMVWIDGI